MGQIAQAAQGQALQVADPRKKLLSTIEASWDRIAAVLPKHMSSERLFQLAVSTVNHDPKLAECDTTSVLSCLMKCSALGLEPSAVDGLGRAYILPFRNKKAGGRMEATFIIGYKGIIDLARRSGELKTIYARAVYEADEFAYWEDENGQHVTYRPNLDVPKDPEKLKGVYCMAILKNDGRVFEYMSRSEVDAIRKRSKSPNSGPWVTDYEAMALKSVIRRAARYLPMSVEAADAIAADETTPEYSEVFRPVMAPVAVATVSDAQPASGQSVAPAGVDPSTGEFGPESGFYADEDIPFPDEQ
jgi:recombination protein RecT